MKKLVLGMLSTLAITSGAMAHSNTMGTPYLGLELGGITTHHHVTGTTYAYSKTAFAPGIGIEVSLTPHGSLGGEFHSAYFGRSSNSGANNSQVTVNPRVDTYMLKVKYKFWPTHNH